MSGSARIRQAFGSARAAGRTLVIPYLTVGYPTLAETVELVLAAEAGGADLLELGLPFSDPLADGPTIQAASQAALAAGASLEKAMEIVRTIRKHSELPLLFMGYANPMFHYGLERFIHVMSEVGVDGLIVPDLPDEEAEEVRRESARRDISWVPLIAPTTPTARIPRLDAAAGDFTYCVALTGVTGVRAELDQALPAYLARVSAGVTKPFVVGFGISRPNQVRQVAPPASGVVVGSALIRVIQEAGTAVARRAAVTEFVGMLSVAAHSTGELD
ncbi:MAG: tryptophan synthase alpha chain [bacterium]|nr:MAG: tryptophan synthase alpha chain [bacterium]